LGSGWGKTRALFDGALLQASSDIDELHRLIHIRPGWQL
jgi:hypothetical protein